VVVVILSVVNESRCVFCQNGDCGGCVVAPSSYHHIGSGVVEEAWNKGDRDYYHDREEDKSLLRADLSYQSHEDHVNHVVVVEKTCVEGKKKKEIRPLDSQHGLRGGVDVYWSYCHTF